MSKATIAKNSGPAILQMVEDKSPSMAGWIIVKKFANPTVNVTTTVQIKALPLL